MSDPYRRDCVHFTGYSPCGHQHPCEGCTRYRREGPRVLLIVLGGLGDVLRSTSLLPGIHRRWPGAAVTWLTSPEAAPLLDNLPLLRRVITLDETTGALLGALDFDVALCPEKSLRAGSLMMAARAHEKLGFAVDGRGAIVALNPEAEHLFRLGLDNQAKFFDNQRSAQDLMAEALTLPWERDRYVIVLTDEERRLAREERQVAGVADDELLVGWSTGASPGFPYKQLALDDQAQLMLDVWRDLRRKDRVRFVLLGGGPADGRRNRILLEELRDRGVPAHASPTDQGLRRGLAAVTGCDLVVSGDSLGLHLAIGMRRPVVAWFGLTSHQEIDLYGSGVRVLSEVTCRPCWRRSCEVPDKCFRRLPWGPMRDAIVEMITVLLRDGRWMGERLIGAFPPAADARILE